MHISCMTASWSQICWKMIFYIYDLGHILDLIIHPLISTQTMSSSLIMRSVILNISIHLLILWSRTLKWIEIELILIWCSTYASLFGMANLAYLLMFSHHIYILFTNCLRIVTNKLSLLLFSFIWINLLLTFVSVCLNLVSTCLWSLFNSSLISITFSILVLHYCSVIHYFASFHWWFFR